MQTTDLKAEIERIAQGREQTLIALAGPPGSGKSTLAETLAQALGPRAQVVPMDGFHRDNDWLDERDLRARKGAPETFDVVGFVQLVRGLRDGTVTKYPLFDRAIDGVVQDAGLLRPDADIIIVEGNYLLLGDDLWRDLHPLWDMTIMLSVDDDTLRNRLTQRWIDHGFSPKDALKKARENDLKNAGVVICNSVAATHTVMN
ncbi:AAA family ATPase [Celeribacter sp.]|uniref:AAA family ATPase n=1 Tax=Celeribacter sp. TaxID=1890673 RepID=UPI003A923727